MRTLRLSLLVLCGALLVAPAPAGWAKEGGEAPRFWNGRDRKDEVTTLAVEYLTATRDRRTAIRTTLDELGFLKLTDVKKHAKALLKLVKKHGPRLTKKQKTFTHGKLSGRIFRQGKGRRGGVLVIALHGGGQGVGDGANAMQKWGSVFGKALVIAPTAPELRATAWNAPDIQAYVLALIDAAKNTYGIDTNKVYVVGHSMGGFGSWAIGCRYADRFAGIGPCAGGVFAARNGDGTARVGPGWVTNLLNTPVRFFHSTDDAQVGPAADQAAARGLEALEEEGYDFDWQYDEYDDIGHGLPKKGLKPIAEWLLERTREPHPKHVLWEPMRTPPLATDRQFWLGQDGAPAGRMEGKVEGNTITITTKGMPNQPVVYLGPELVDVAKPVTITVNGTEKCRAVVPARYSILLHTIATGNDPAQWYAHAVDIR